MRSTMVKRQTFRLSTGELVVAAPFEDVDVPTFASNVAWFNSVRPSWMPTLSFELMASESIAWMR